MKVAQGALAHGRAQTYQSRSWIAKFALVSGAIALLVLLAAGSAFAATPTIVNTSSTGGQTNWLESFTLSDDTGNQTHRIWVTLNVRHDPGREVTSIKIDDDYNGSDNTSSETVRNVSAQQPNVVGGYDHSRISYNYLPPTSGNDLACGNVFGGHVATSTKPLRIRARLDNGEETATSVSNIKWATADCGGKDDRPRVFNRSQSATSINVGQSVNFTFTGDDSDAPVTSNRDFGGINWRLRRLSDGATTSETKVCYGNSDNTAKTLPVTFSRRGRWVVEAELLNSNNSCGVNPYSDAWFYLGAVDVNSPAADSPNLTLNATRPQIGGNTTVTATFDDADDNAQGGRVQNIEWDLDQNTGNGVSGFEAIQLGTASGLTSSQSRTIDTSGMTPGAKTIRARVTDNGAMSGADNIRRTKTVSTTFLVDTPPVASDTSHTVETSGDLTFNLAATDADDDDLGYAISQGPEHGTVTGSGATRIYTPDAGFAGQDQITFEVNDGYGGTDSATVSFTVIPNIAPFNGPTGTRDSRGGQVDFSSDAEDVTFECALDESDWAACASPFAVTDLPDGEHEINVRALAGGETSTVKTAAWTVDAFPGIEIVDGPEAESSMTEATVEFVASEAGVTVDPGTECRLDDLAWTTCHSPVTYQDLDDGTHQISIRATDAYGKQSSETVQWNITTAGSEAVIGTPGPATFSRERDATISFTATGTATSFECSLDGGAWESCESPAALTGLADGSHTFRVRSIDALGNPDELPAQITWKVDRTSPVVTILSGPSGAIPAKPAMFTFKANESLSSFECSLDGGNYVACNSPFRLTGDLPDGPHQLRVAATDRAGNRSLAAARSFRVLSVAPPVALTGGPAQGAVTTSSAATFGFTTIPAASSFECQVDEGRWRECASPATVTGLTDGPHSFAVRSIDEVGNLSAEPAVRNWTVDTVAPETTVTAGPAGQVKTTEAELTFSASESPATFECSLDGAGFEPCASPASFAGLGDGPHEFRVRATDGAGNRDQTPASRAWSIDTTEPPPAELPPPPAEPDPCTFLIEQDRCGDPYVVAGAKAPFRNPAGKGAINFDIDSGGSALQEIRARYAIGLKTTRRPGKRGLKVGRVVLEGESRSVVPLVLPAKRRQVNVIGKADGLTVTLKQRTIIVSGIPEGTTAARIRLKSTRALRISTSICGTRLWRTVLTDSRSNREFVDARADVKCVRKGTR
ncbi:MAG: cadherin-like domain-containing protein [Actinomycetota bacterium]|nr:cadherin-like domain-containing protein [Actinomycetota bacterium]